MEEIPITIAEVAYMAGLFDGEGHVEYKKRLVKQKKGKNKAYRTWSIRCEMSMTDKGVMEWFHETVGFGTLNKREAKKSWTRSYKLYSFPFSVLLIFFYIQHVLLHQRVRPCRQYHSVPSSSFVKL